MCVGTDVVRRTSAKPCHPRLRDRQRHFVHVARDHIVTARDQKLRLASGVRPNVEHQSPAPILLQERLEQT